jgi:hypothetical protein
MHALKTMLMVALGLGSVWTAWQVAPAKTSGMLTGVAYAQTAPAKVTNPPVAQAAQDAAVEKQLAEINAALASDGEIREFKPKEPLPADQAIEMSSEL